LHSSLPSFQLLAPACCLATISPAPSDAGSCMRRPGGRITGGDAQCSECHVDLIIHLTLRLSGPHLLLYRGSLLNGRLGKILPKPPREQCIPGQDRPQLAEEAIERVGRFLQSLPDLFKHRHILLSPARSSNNRLVCRIRHAQSFFIRYPADPFHSGYAGGIFSAAGADSVPGAGGKTIRITSLEALLYLQLCTAFFMVLNLGKPLFAI
jgi:hypothetical protein